MSSGYDYKPKTIPHKFRATIAVPNRFKLACISHMKASRSRLANNKGSKSSKKMKMRTGSNINTPPNVKDLTSSSSSGSLYVEKSDRSHEQEKEKMDIQKPDNAHQNEDDKLKSLSISSKNKLEELKDQEEILRNELKTLGTVQSSLLFLLKRTTRYELMRNHEGKELPHTYTTRQSNNNDISANTNNNNNNNMSTRPRTDPISIKKGRAYKQ